MKSILLILTYWISLLSLSFGATHTIDLVPFSIELRSKESSDQNNNVLSQKLRRLTSSHFRSFALPQEFSHWGTREDLVLSIRDELAFTEESSSTSYVSSTVSFEGSFSLLDNIKPTAKETEDFQRSAFIGQAKLDYLKELKKSDDAFLSSLYDCSISFDSPTTTITTTTTTTNTNTKKSNLGTILIASAVGISCALVAICVIHYCPNVRKKQSLRGISSTTRNRFLTKHSRLRDDDVDMDEVPDLELGSTKSLSPTNSLNVPLPQPVYFDGAASIPTRKASSRSVMTADTLDVNNNMDMLAWKHNSRGCGTPFVTDITGIEEESSQSIHLAHNKSANTIDVNSNVDMLAWKHKKKDEDGVPFETDITMISKKSPNKTMDVKVRSERSSRKKKSRSYRNKQKSGHLSKDVLSQHNVNRFGESSQTYQSKNRK